MADYIKKIKTANGDKQIDFLSLANLPGSSNGTFTIIASEDFKSGDIVYSPFDSEDTGYYDCHIDQGDLPKKHRIFIVLEDIAKGNTGKALYITASNVKTSYEFIVYISSSEWNYNSSSNQYECRINHDNISINDNPIVDIEIPDNILSDSSARSEYIENYYKIEYIRTYDKYIDFCANEEPTVDLNIRFMVV